MKKLLLPFLLLCLSSGFAQTSLYHPFPTDSALWSEEVSMGASTMHYQYGIFGDTLIGANTYHKLYQRNIPCVDTSMTVANSTLIGGLREDGMKREYFYPISWMFCPAGNEIKIYDFSKTTIGDTIQFNQPCNSIPLLTIVSVDSVLINGSYRKHWTFAEGEKWIEGIGSKRALLSLVTAFPTCSCSNDLLCHKQSEDLVYINSAFNYCYCDLGVGVPENISPKLLLYPNPVNNKLHITVPDELTGGEIMIMNATGQKIAAYPVGSGDQVIETTKLAEGLYYILIQNGITQQRGRFIVGK